MSPIPLQNAVKESISRKCGDHASRQFDTPDSPAGISLPDSRAPPVDDNDDGPLTILGIKTRQHIALREMVPAVIRPPSGGVIGDGEKHPQSDPGRNRRSVFCVFHEEKPPPARFRSLPKPRKRDACADFYSDSSHFRPDKKRRENRVYNEFLARRIPQPLFPGPSGPREQSGGKDMPPFFSPIQLEKNQIVSAKSVDKNPCPIQIFRTLKLTHL